MSDLYEVLRSMEGGEDLAMRLEKYTQGIFSGFLNNPTNVEPRKSDGGFQYPRYGRGTAADRDVRGFALHLE